MEVVGAVIVGVKMTTKFLINFLVLLLFLLVDVGKKWQQQQQHWLSKSFYSQFKLKFLIRFIQLCA